MIFNFAIDKSNKREYNKDNLKKEVLYMFKVLALGCSSEINAGNYSSLERARSAAEYYRRESAAWSCYIVFAPTGEIVETM